MALIELKQVEKWYGSLKGRGPQTHVLRGVDLTVEPAEKCVIVGPSGVGKSTLLHIMGLMDRPSSGQLRFDGRDASGFKPKQLAALRNQSIGFIFQHHFLLKECTVMENIMIPAMIAGMLSSEQVQRATRLAQWVKLDHRLNHFPSQLSGGERQRTAIARALMNQPKVVLADEITGNLDTDLKVEIMRVLIDSCRMAKAALVGVTHDGSMLQYYDRIYQLKNGHITPQVPSVP
jgi:lipoprotein-releasing system ATP-binding protein